MIVLPNDSHTPQLHHALNWMLQQREQGENILAYLTEISDDLDKMELTGIERDYFELGMYLAQILEDDAWADLTDVMQV